MNNVDKEYFRLLDAILTKGRIKKNRTGIDTIGVFGEQAKFDLYPDFPILTTKKVWFKGIVHELLWFIKGDTNIKYLVDNNVHIWDSWAFDRYQKEKPKRGGLMLADPLLLTNQEKYWIKNQNQDVIGFLNKRDIEKKRQDFVQKIKEDVVFANEWGELGEGTYGGMWRSFPYYTTTYDGQGPDGWDLPVHHARSVDQIQKVLDKLKTNPDDRRMIVSAWHPYWVDHCSLPPCHVLYHFNTEELTMNERYEACFAMGFATDLWDDCDEEYVRNFMDDHNVPKRRLNCLLYQRSLDLPVGGPFNISSYALLTCMVAQCVNMQPGIFTWATGDTHIYVDQIPMIKEQLAREPKELPKLWLNPEVKNLFDFKYEDIRLIGYDPHPAIKMPVAV